MHTDEITLFNACITNCYQFFEIAALLESGVDVNKQSSSGRAPLHWIAESNNTQLAQLLLKNNPNIEIKSITGLTPLHIAASCNSLDVMSCLITAGANIEAQDKSGFTPLHWAAHKGYREAAVKLIAAGAHIDSKNHLNVTPIQLAFLSGYEYISRYLFNYHQFLCLRSSTDNKIPSTIEQHKEIKNRIQSSASCILINSTDSSFSNFSPSSVTSSIQYSLENEEEYMPAFLSVKKSSQVTSSRKL